MNLSKTPYVLNSHCSLRVKKEWLLPENFVSQSQWIKLKPHIYFPFELLVLVLCQQPYLLEYYAKLPQRLALSFSLDATLFPLHHLFQDACEEQYNLRKEVIKLLRICQAQ